MNITKVMLVDDEPDIQKIGRMSLERVGRWQTIVATSGQEAIALALREPPDLVLLDVMMPDMDGPMTLKQLREQPALAHIPIIFLTAKVQQSEVDRYLRLGAAGVLRKPFDPITLPEEIRAIVAARGC